MSIPAATASRPPKPPLRVEQGEILTATMLSYFEVANGCIAPFRQIRAAPLPGVNTGM